MTWFEIVFGGLTLAFAIGAILKAGSDRHDESLISSEILSGCAIVSLGIIFLSGITQENNSYFVGVRLAGPALLIGGGAWTIWTTVKGKWSRRDKDKKEETIPVVPAAPSIPQNMKEALPDQLLNPPRNFRPGQTTVFLREGCTIDTSRDPEGRVADADYLDGSWLNTQKEALDAWKKAEESGHPRQSPAHYEAFLRAILDNEEARLVHIILKTNPNTGAPYFRYGVV